MSKLRQDPSLAWVPGILHKKQIEQLRDEEFISTESTKGLDIGICSIDLSLSSQVVKMKKGSIKPSHGYRYHEILSDTDLAEIQSANNNDGSFFLARKSTYVIKLQERLDQRLGNIEMYGQATAKSSVGRVDVLARLIVDGMDKYESFEPRLLEKASGEMYVEVTPITFNVRVLPGTSINQLRLFYGSPADAEITGKPLFKTVLGFEATDNSLSVDLDGEEINGEPTIAYCTYTPVPDEPIPLWKSSSKPDARKY